MAVVPTDLLATVSTQYNVWFLDRFNNAVPVERNDFARLVMDIDIPNFQGNKVNFNWLGAAPQLREWVDEKRAQGLSRYNWEVTVKRWEATIEVDLDAIADARWNQYRPRIEEMADNAGRHRYQLLTDLIRLGDATLAYDGQYFYDTDHSEGLSGTQSNKLTGTGTSEQQITDDYYTAMTALMKFKDDKGHILNPTTFRPLVWIPANATMVQRFEKLQQLKIPGLTGASENVIQDRFDLVVDASLTDVNDWYMFRTDLVQRPFININREPFHYEDNFGTGHPDVWSRRVGQASVVGRDNMSYGMWQGSVKVVNA